MTPGQVSFLVVILFICGVGVGAELQDGMMQRRAIEAGVAHYDPQTGRFTWNTEKKAEK